MKHTTCPICKTPNQQNNTPCTNCGATIPTTQTQLEIKQQPHEKHYTNVHGETDLFETIPELQKKRPKITTTIILTITVLIFTTLILRTQLSSNSPPETTHKINPNNPNFVTNTVQPTLALATTTTGPPTPSRTPTGTITPTQGPCTQQVQAGDSLIALAAQCGHQNLDVIQVILEINNLTDPNQLQIGQILQIPWPTPTTSKDPNEDTTTGNDNENNTPRTPDQATRPSQLNPPTETLQPGVIWHQTTKDESIISVAIQYGATLRILSELNPEVTFSQCDFGLGSGGPSCIVQIYEGQLIRVPAPTPTPTTQPTLSGSETPTPTATATFNAPSALAPQPRALFNQDATITLRWTTTGTLGENQSYHITLQNKTTGEVHAATTRELFFIIPTIWQSQTDERQEYTWTIAVIDSSDPNIPQFETEPRQFIWQGRSVKQ